MYNIRDSRGIFRTAYLGGNTRCHSDVGDYLVWDLGPIRKAFARTASSFWVIPDIWISNQPIVWETRNSDSLFPYRKDGHNRMAPGDEEFQTGLAKLESLSCGCDQGVGTISLPAIFHHGFADRN